MGFYGNITNTSRTTFAFDRTYANRYEMDLAAGGDGVYAGRYVLVNYETDTSEDSYVSTFFCYDDGTPTMYTSLQSCLEASSNASAVDSVPNASNNSFISGATSTNNGNAIEVNYIAPVKTTKITSSHVRQNEVVRLGVGRHITNISQFDQYIRVTNKSNLNDVTYEFVTKADFDAYWTALKVENYNTKHAHIVNFKANFSNIEDVKNNTNPIFIVPAGYAYQTNLMPELWSASYGANDTEVTWVQIAADASNYFTNFNIDKSFYKVSRGYDSTVWQKVYASGRETYVMVAELNTVVPTFDIRADAPSLLPIAPHFDSVSNNVYYRFHWQPQWGFRVKGASPLSTGPKIAQTGKFISGTKVKLRDATVDKVYYPSDEKVAWEASIYDTTTDLKSQKYYNVKTNSWVNKPTPETQVPAAIYYNKAGFNPVDIVYSSDILDAERPSYNQNIADSKWENHDVISITPTGLSGNVYNNHNNSADETAQVDTQEVTMMLPSLGDSMAKIWDLVYGGRGTNETINQTNRRNMDIAWQNGRPVIPRLGLRLVSDQDGQMAYSPEEVNTIAGCINSVHDALGMIITPLPVDKDENGKLLLDKETGIYKIVSPSAAATFDEGRIYYNEATQQYYRKHLTYNYVEIEDEYTFEEVKDVTAENYMENFYFTKSGNNYIPATNFVAGTTYYARALPPRTLYEAIPKNKLTNFDGSKYFFQDFSGVREANNDLMMDYYSFNQYQSGRKYYQDIKVSNGKPYTLSAAYAPNVYYYSNNGGYWLDSNAEPYLSSDAQKPQKKTYYTINQKEVVDIASKRYNGVYVPNIYYYYWPEFDPNTGEEITGNYILDTNFPALTTYPEVYEEGKTQKDNPAGYKKDYEGLPLKHFRLKPVDIIGGDRYILEVSYQIVPLTAGKYTPGTYYIDNNGEKQLSFEFKTGQTYFKKIETYRKLNDKEFAIDPQDPLTLVNFSENTFYKKVVDQQTGAIIRYELQTLDSLFSEMKSFMENTSSENALLPDYVAFGSRYDNILEREVFTDVNGKPIRTALISQTLFYEPNKYHYLDEVETSVFKGSYILDIEQQMDPNKKYFMLSSVTPVPDDIIFYEPNVYYTFSEAANEYRLSFDKTAQDNITYYKKNGVYVLEDKAKVYTKGAEWNINAHFVPSTLKLATRTQEYELVPLRDFARDYNTINGAILRINHMLEDDNALTRDSQIVRGAVNKLNDIITSLSDLTTEELVVVDNYGRLRSVPSHTQQTNSLQTKAAKSANETAEAFDYRYRKSTLADIYPRVDSVDAMQNQWITLNVNPSLEKAGVTIHHNFQPVKDTTSASNNNTDNVVSTKDSDKINLYTPIVDKTGHVVGKNIETVTLPYSFKTIKATNSTDVDNDAAATINNNGQIADNTQDILTFSATNNWIKLDNNTEDTIKIGHKVNAIDTVSAGTSNLNTENGAADEKNLTIYDWSYDKAGHITSKKAHTYTLPFGFKTITTNGVGEKTTNMTTSNSQAHIVADKTQDTLNINSDNKWIRIATNAANDTMTIAHEIHDVTEDFSQATLSTTEPGAVTFAVPTYSFDTAGHYTGVNTKTITMPFGYGKIVGDNKSGNNYVTTSASATFDTLTIEGDTWITSTISTDKVSLAHSTPHTAQHAVVDNVTPAFGSTFTIKDLDFDARGHYANSGTHTVTIPKGSLTQTTVQTDANVLTSISFVDTSGAITVGRTNLGALQLGTYTAASTLNTAQEGTTINASGITTTTTLGAALSTLDARIMAETKARIDAITSLDVTGASGINAGQTIKAWSEADGKVTITTQNIRITSSQISDKTDSYDSSGTAVVTGTAVAAALGTLDVKGASNIGADKTISAWSETDGKISITTQDIAINKSQVSGLGTMAGANTSDYFTKTATFSYTAPTAAEQATFDNQDKTIAWLFKKVKSLEDRLTGTI